MISDINIYGKFTHKARFVTGGHMNDPPSYVTYSSVVLRYSVRLGFLLELLKYLDICAMDIGKAYLNTECR